MMLAHAQHMRIRLIHIALGTGGEGQQRFHFRIQGERPALVQIDHAARFVQLPVCVLRLITNHHPAHRAGWMLQLRQQIIGIADQKWVRIDQQGAVLLAFDRQ